MKKVFDYVDSYQDEELNELLPRGWSFSELKLPRGTSEEYVVVDSNGEVMIQAKTLQATVLRAWSVKRLGRDAFDG